MALDVDLTKDLARLIEAETFSMPKLTSFTYDRLFDEKKITALTIRLTIDGFMRERSARGRWHHTAVIQVVVLSPQQIGNEDALTANLDFLDEVLNFIEKAKPNGRIAMAMEPLHEGRYDFDKFQNDGQFRSGVVVKYNLTSGK